MHLSVTEIVHDLVRPHVRPGDTALDATAGNGHDTLFLAQCVGPTGRVFAWDIQPLAIERTAALLTKHGVTCVELKLGDHAELDLSPLSVSERGLGGEVWPVLPSDHPGHAGRAGWELAAAMFNLGYLPASDRSIATTAESSVRAIRAAAEHLRPGGILTVLVYVGHSGGAEEAAAVGELLRGMPIGDFDLGEVAIPGGRSTPPQLFALVRRLLR